MLSLLAKLVIKDQNALDKATLRRRWGMLCGAYGIFLNLLLFCGKFFAGLITRSIAITADAFNNLSDAGSSLVTLIGFKMAGAKPDKDHPFGHGRIEYISGFIVALAILLMGFELGKSSFDKILNPQAVELSLLPAIILLVSAAVKLYMAYYNKAVGSKIDSPAMAATSADSLSDALSTSAVLIAMCVGHFANINIDGWAGMVVALLIIWAGIKAAKDTIDPLLGVAPQPQFVEEIYKTVLEYPEIEGIHDLIVHDYGPGRMMISLHAEVPCDGDILELHDTIDLAERKLADNFGCDAVIHMDPIATNDEYTVKLRMKMSAVAKEIDKDITIHDFRIVKGPTHTNLIFDAVLPHSCAMKDEDIASAFEQKAKAIDVRLFTVITIDKLYS